MVNYCAVANCGRNCANSSHLHFFGLPREKQRLKAWLEAIGRTDILEYPAVKRGKHPNHRVCSRHFAPSSIKNKHLCEDAIPSLFLPQGPESSWAENDNEIEDKEHIDIICNSCESKIQGVLYKCIVCPDFDLCVKCERFGAHNEHYMLRIPHPTKFTITKNLVAELQHILSLEHTDTSLVKHYTSSDDDIPITEYMNSENSSNLPNDIKNKIRNEVSRVLKLKNTESKMSVKRKTTGKKKEQKRVRETKDDEMVQTVAQPPEVVFAEVIDVNGGIMDVPIKEELQPTVEGIGEQQITQRISDELSAFILDANQYT